MAALELSEEIAAFHAARMAILRDNGPCWVVVFGAKVERTFRGFEEAAEYAIKAHPEEPFLIRHVDEATPHIPLVVVEAV